MTMPPVDSTGTAQSIAPVLRVLPIVAIQFTAQNPRTDAAADLDELIASIAAVQEPYLAQLPIVQETAPDVWSVIAGERRIRAVTAAGWQTVACLVYRPAPHESILISVQYPLKPIPINKIKGCLPEILAPSRLHTFL